MQARDGPIQLSLVSGVSKLVLVYVALLMCATHLLPQVRYPLIWGVGVGSVV